MRTFVRAQIRKSKAGFTLIELLVVVAIIAVLIAILLPAISNARKTAVTVSCSSNLHQIGVGFQLYNDANSELYPPHWGGGQWIWPSNSTASTWRAFVASYLGWNGKTDAVTFSVLPVYRCPGDIISQITGVTYESTGPNWVNGSYGYNYIFFSSQSGYGRARRNMITDPSQKILLADSDTTSSYGSLLVHASVAVGSIISNRHNDANVLFADGHVLLKSRKAIHGTDYGDWTPLWLSNSYYKYWVPTE